MPEAHTALNIQMFLQKTLEKFLLTEKALAFTTDGGSNVVKAVTDMGLVQISCFAHKLNLAANDVLKGHVDLADLRARVSRIVTLTRKSSIARETFISCQTFGTRKMMIQEVATRWNSTFSMLQRALELKEVIKAFTDHYSVSDSIGHFSNEDWSRIAETVELLKPLYEFTVEMSSERSVTASKIIPMAKLLVRHYNTTLDALRQSVDNYEEPSFKFTLAELLATTMMNRMGGYESVTELANASLLDPRYKRIGFSDQQVADAACVKLKTECIALARKMNSELDSTTEKTPSLSVHNNSKVSSLWAMYDKPHSTQKAIMKYNAETELRNYYKDLPLDDKSVNPALWWGQNQSTYPVLHRLASKYLCISATSVPSERLFSDAGKVISEMRSRLTDSNAEMIIFINAHLKKSKLEDDNDESDDVVEVEELD